MSLTATVEQPLQLEIDRLTPHFLDLDQVADFAGRRQHFFFEAAGILEANRQSLVSGAPESVPAPIDVLSGARQLIEIERLYGQGSSEYAQKRMSMDQNSARSVAEIESANTWEYFEPIFHQLDRDKSQYWTLGESHSDIVRNGLSPLADPEEQQIRMAEYVEEMTFVAAGQSEVVKCEHSVLTIKECPDFAIRDYQTYGDTRGHYGYVPRVRKLTISKDILRSDGREHSQFALPGTYITHDVITSTLQDEEALETGAAPSSLELRLIQLYSDSADADIHLIRRLDEKASELWGLNIFIGEEVSSDHPKDYQAAMEEAKERQAKLWRKAQAVTDFQIAMAREGVDVTMADEKLNKFLTRNYIDECIANPELALRVFNGEVVATIMMINNLNGQGYETEAARLRGELNSTTTVTYCGAGACGLVEASLTEVAEAKSLGLRGDDIVKDTQRSCPGCGKKSVFYDLKYGSKACTKCKKKEIKNRELPK